MIIIIDDYFNSSRMHFQGFTEGTGFAHEDAAALAQGAVDSFDDVGLSFALGTGPVLPAGQHLGVGFPAVGKIPAMAVVAVGQGLPKLA